MNMRPETTPLPILNYKTTAPDNSVTFSHVHNTWIASWCGNWVAVSADEARSLYDSGYRLLDGLESGTPVPVKAGREVCEEVDSKDSAWYTNWCERDGTLDELMQRARELA
jgi:hypothetical protein